MNYKIIIILFIILIFTTSAVSIENTLEENKKKSAISIEKKFDDKNKTLIIGDPSTKKMIFEIQQVSVKPDLVTMEEIFEFTSYEDYAFDSTKDFKVRWDKVKGINNIIKSKWEILENVEYSATVPDYIDIEKQITIYNIQSHEDVTDIYDNNPLLLDFGELHTTNKWTVISPNKTVTIGFENHVVNSTNPLNITFYWNTTEQIDTHIEPKYRKDWRPFSPADKKIKKGESITVKLTFYKKAEKGSFSIKTVPMFAGVEEEKFTWWDGSWDYCVNNLIPDGIRPYQLPVTISNSAGTNTATNVYFNGHANPDFSDIRFILDNTTVLPYWIEDNGPTGKVWANIKDNGVVNIYYGNPSATDLSNGKDTFEFFDDFSNFELGSNPVLSPTETWESPDLRWGTLAYLNGIYYIYYSSGSSATADIGRATSTDLIHWTKHGGNPVIHDSIGPSLLKELDGITPVFYDNKYWMLTMKYDGTAIELRSALSIDSDDWTLENGNLISKVPGTWYENYLYTTSFSRDNGKYYISMEARDNSQIWKIGLFDGGSSPTGPYSDQGVLISPTLPWEGRSGVLDPEMRKFGDTYYLFYTGNVEKETYQNSYATSSNLGGPYIKSEIKITPISNTYPAILVKDDFYYILTDDHIPRIGIGKNLYKRKDLNGMFGSPFEWYQDGSPTFSNSELLINADGEYIRSQSAYLYKAMKIRAKFSPLSGQNTYQYFGFAADSFAGVTDSEMIVSYDDPDLKTWSGNSVNYESSSIYDPSYFGSYHDYEILWRNGEAKFIVDDVLKATQTTYVADTPQPVGIYNSQTNANLYVDWVFVRNYIFPELSWAIWSVEHTHQTGNAPIMTDISPTSPVSDVEGATKKFNINIDQSVDVVWYLNNDVVKDTEMGVMHATYTNTSASIGTWNIKAVATNTNGDATQTWTWIVSSPGASSEIIFTDPTPADGATITRDHAYINTLVTDSSTAFIDWDSSLAGWWRFNSEDGETPTLFRDWSSYSNDVTCSGTNCPTLSSGKFGNALSFDGSDDYISTTSTGIPVTSPFTLELWVNAQGVSDWTDIFRKEGSWAVQINPEGKINLEITGKQDTISNVVVPSNAWTHLAITFEGTSVNFYKDGILSDTKNQINVPDTGSNSIYIGGYGSWYFNGALDEIKIHNRVLSPGEIKASYDAGTNELYRDFTNLEDGTYHYKACAQNLLGNVDQTQTRTLTVTSSGAPIITDFSPASPVSDDERATRTFTINMDQSVDVVWHLNNDVVKDSEIGVTHATYTNTSASIGTWNVIATATNANGNVSKEWTWNVISQSPSDDLSAYWNLDENTGTTVSDSSGNGNTGTIYGSTWTTGKKGFALLFNGVDDYVDVGSTLDFSEGFTILMWVKRDAGSSWRTLISKGESTLLKDHNYILYFNPTNAIEFAIGDGINYRSFKTTNTYDTNWHHLAVEFVSSDDMRIYVDGVLQPGTYDPNGIATTPVANSKKTLIGASGTTTEFFNGVIDEVKILNKVLTTEEIAQDYNS